MGNKTDISKRHMVCFISSMMIISSVTGILSVPLAVHANNYATTSEIEGDVKNLTAEDTLELNDGTINENYGTISVNAGTINENNGNVTDNYGEVHNSDEGNVGINHTDATVEGGRVTDNYGSVNNAVAVTNNYASGTVTADPPEAGGSETQVTNNWGSASGVASVTNNMGTVTGQETDVAHNYDGGTFNGIIGEGEGPTPAAGKATDPRPTPPSTTVYNVTVMTDGHGEASASPRSGVSGTRVMLREVPDDGYRFKQWEVISGGVELDNYRDYTTSFTIRSANAEIKAHFEKKEEHTRENDYGPEESKSEAAWTPEKAAATIAAEKAAKQQAAGMQLAAVQTLLRTKTSDRAGTGRDVIALDMTKVDILDPATVNLLLLNNRFAFNVKISVPGGLTTTIMIPANFNFRPFIKADGTMNIHEVLWWIISKKK